MTESAVYTPPPSLVPFLTSDKFVSLVVGPVGSTKTTAGILKIAYMAKKMAPCKDGIRRSRAIWIRNTREQLRDTSIPDFLKWFPDGQAGIFLKTEFKFTLKFDDVQCEVLFRGLDDSNDVRRLLSLQASFAVLDEFREINKDVFEALTARLGRYPDGSMVPHREEWGLDEKGHPIQGCVTDDGKPNKRIWGMTNPPDMDTFWEQYLSDPPRNADVFFQPSAMSPEADWLQYLPTNYYEDIMEGKSEEYIDVYVHAKFGKSLSGQPVFKAFNRDIHVAKQTLTPFRGSTSPLIIGMDFGLTPACTISQIDPMGRFVTYADLVSEGMGVLRFSREKLKPLLANRFAGMPVVIIGDPAGVQRAQTDERSVFDILKAEGFRTLPAKTNSVVARINAVDAMLTRMVDGKAAHIIDPGCKNLITALAGGYRYKLKTTGEYDDKPEKNKHSHVCFVAGTQVATPDGEVAIETIKPGDYVCTPLGARKVLRAEMTDESAAVVTATFSNGRELTGTPDHPIFVSGYGFIPLDGLQYDDLLVFGEMSCQKPNTRSRSSTGLSTTGSQPDTINRTAAGTCTGRSTPTSTDQSLMVYTSTTSTTISRTTARKISQLTADLITSGTTRLKGLRKLLTRFGRGWLSPVLQPANGTGQPPVDNGIANTQSSSGRKTSQSSVRALTVGRSTPPTGELKKLGTVAQNASQPRVEQAVKTMWNEPVLSAVACSLPTDTLKLSAAPGNVVLSQWLGRERVYALTVEDCPMYFASGVLVSNCDAHQYASLHADGTLTGDVLKTTAKPVKKVKWVA